MALAALEGDEAAVGRLCELCSALEFQELPERRYLDLRPALLRLEAQVIERAAVLPEREREAGVVQRDGLDAVVAAGEVLTAIGTVCRM